MTRVQNILFKLTIENKLILNILVRKYNVLVKWDFFYFITILVIIQKLFSLTFLLVCGFANNYSFTVIL